MSKEPITIVPKAGIRVDLDAFREVNLESGDKTLLSDVENRDNLLFADDAMLKPYLARFVRVEDDAALFEAKSSDTRRTELLCRSKPLEFKHGVPDDVKRGLENAYADLRAMAKQPGVTAEAKEFISSLRLADPKESPELYRVVKHNGKQHLFVIWGIVRHDGSEMYPIDAINRIPSHSRRKNLLAALAALAAILALLFLLWPFFSWLVPTKPTTGTESPMQVRGDGTTQAGAPSEDTAVSTTENSDLPSEVDKPALPALPKTDSDEPPFLIVQPQAIVVGEGVNIIPRNIGILTLSSYTGREFLHREAKGVRDAEYLQIYAPGVRKVEFKPTNTEFSNETLGLIIYPEPLIRKKAVRIVFPEGISLDQVAVEWGDGENETISKSDIRYVQHQYVQIGRYEIVVNFPKNRSWASHSFQIEIVEDE